ncbi:MAG: DUF2191 domain-containing protein [Leptospiraceae bacterium]|nr:DUF2191 domain-containing protein [Leptospiraceae bacterium]MCB1314860.1 DUF2191 domain-containing protein [Leptospiraceae bacterium]MCB1322928.1 DUF2191 domain-containing protein [Leptospiraceae bacterium]
MKVTALLPDELIAEVRALSKGSNITDSLLVALNEWVQIRHVRTLNEAVAKKPLKFQKNFAADDVRQVNRKRSGGRQPRSQS